MYLKIFGKNLISQSQYNLLQKDKKSIEKEIGEPLNWKWLKTYNYGRVRLSKLKADPANKQNWQEQHEWLHEKLELFHKVFATRVQSLEVTFKPIEFTKVKSEANKPSSSIVTSPTIASPSPLLSASSTERISSVAQVQSSTPPVQPARKSNRLRWITASIVTLLIVGGGISLLLEISYFNHSNNSNTTDQRPTANQQVSTKENTASEANTNTANPNGSDAVKLLEKEIANNETKINQLKEHRAELLVNYTEEYPEVKRINKEIASLENQNQVMRERMSELKRNK